MATGPLGPTGPTVDPNWAWNVPGWNVQGGTAASPTTGPGDTEGQNLTGAQLSNNAFLSEPEALSGYIARSMDPALNSLTSAFYSLAATTTAAFAAVQVLDPVVTSKVTIFAKYSTTSAVAGVGLYNFAGTQIATCNSAALGASAGVITTSWSTAAVLSPGTYYIGVVTHSGSGFVDFAATALTVENALLGQATTFAANVLNWRFFSATVTANTLPATISGTIAGTTNGWFVGLS